MSQKFIKQQNTNSQSSACGKYFAKAVYDKKLLVKDVVFEETHENTVESERVLNLIFPLLTETFFFFRLMNKHGVLSIHVFIGDVWNDVVHQPQT